MRLPLVAASLAVLLLPSVSVARVLSGTNAESSDAAAAKQPGNVIIDRQFRVKPRQTSTIVNGGTAHKIEARQESGIPRKRRSLPISTLAQAKQTCRINESVCGIAGLEDNPRAFECINTKTSLESCGGCGTPHPFYEPHRVTSKGVDCGHLPGILSATCKESRCVISKCRNGLVLNFDKTACVPASQLVNQPENVGGEGISV